jgi:hypothetical protein
MPVHTDSVIALENVGGKPQGAPLPFRQPEVQNPQEALPDPAIVVPESSELI